MKKLEDKVAIITGGAGGIGRAAAKLYCDEGAKVMLVDIDEVALKALAAEIGAPNADYMVADVGDQLETEAYVTATKERFGSIDIALLNAGIEGMIQPIPDYTPEVFDKVINVNVRSVFLGLRASMPLMASEGGSIVITSSTAGIRAVGGMSAYVASKHAVIGLMRTAAVEGAESNIRVNSVNPSPINTRMIPSIEKQAGLPTGDPENRPMARHTPPAPWSVRIYFVGKLGLMTACRPNTSYKVKAVQLISRLISPVGPCAGELLPVNRLPDIAYWNPARLDFYPVL